MWIAVEGSGSRSEKTSSEVPVLIVRQPSPCP
jgi:hypothetical protein